MQQIELIHEDIYEAVRGAVDACGGPKQIASLLWPAKPLAEARRLLLHCLDPERPEKLGLEELVMIGRLARERDCHLLAAWLMGEWRYQAPIPQDPEDERSRLQREFRESVKLQAHLVRCMERLAQDPELRAVK